VETKGKRTSNTKAKTALQEVQSQSQTCPDCGKRHKEIFPLIRITHGAYVGQEFEMIVKPVIKKWGDFVDKHL